MENKSKTQAIISAIIVAILALAGVLVVNNVTKSGTSTVIEYSDDERTATVTIGEDDIESASDEEHGLGDEIEQEDIPTVESVDGDGPVVDLNAGEGVSILDGDEEHGLGSYIYAPTDTWSAFKNYTLGNCYNTDNAFGEQCWDLADVFWQNAVGRRHSTCGTGVAKGAIEDGCWQKNAGDEFMMIWDATELKAGDWVIFTNGYTGHVGMAIGSYNNGYITLLGQNQGGGLCAGSTMGAKTNIINISLKYFGGAFRYKPYEEARLKAEEEARKKAEEEVRKKTEEEEKKVEDGATVEETYTVRSGDTLGGIIRKMGWYDGNKLYGNDGYAQKVASANGIEDRGLIYPGQLIRNL